MRDGAGGRDTGSGYRKNYLHLPNASADRAGSSRQLPDLWNGLGSEERYRGQRRRERRAARHDAAILDRRRAEPAGLRRGDGSSLTWCTGMGAGRRLALDAIYPEHAGCAVVRLAIFPAWLAIAR